MSQWSHVLSQAEINAYHALTASLDPAYASGERAWYESRTVNQLKVAAAQAWDANIPTAYQLAKSYLVLKST